MTDIGYADAVVVAAGRSRRMGGPDKLRVPLAGRPLLAWSVEALAASAAVRDIVVVTVPEDVASLAGEPWIQAVAARVVAGGERRQDSAVAGLSATRSDCEVVLVHDGARPFLSPALVEAVAGAARRHGAAIPVVPIADSLKRVAESHVVGAVERAGLFAAQTPQGARRDLLSGAFAAADEVGRADHTDEASVLAQAGIEVATVVGEPDNFKVTSPDDLRWAQALAAERTRTGQRSEPSGPAGPRRVALGRDSHPFGPGDGLAVGGILIAEAPRLHGHSDGDVALHAIADAVLGGARSGDLGRLFPASDPATGGAASGVLLAESLRLARSAGWAPVSVDLLLLGARPTFGPARLEAIRGAVSVAMGLDRDAISVRASSGNLDGPTGAGRSLAADALVTLAPVDPEGR